MPRRLHCSVCVLTLVTAAAASARVVAFEAVERRPVLDGRKFGPAGAYEIVKARARFAVDPANAANRIVTDIGLAPRNAAGEVEFAADVYLIKPVRIERGNGAALLEINNRGGKGMLGMFQFASTSLDPAAEEEFFRDPLLFEQGFTLVWVGWQFDPPVAPDRMYVYPPSARRPDGQPIRGLVRADFTLTDREMSHSLGDRDHRPYPAADAPENVLTVRDSAEGERRVVPRDKWRFARMEDGRPVPDAGRVWLDGGFEPFKIYEVVYVSENPPLVGLGAAAVRDFIAYLKHGGGPAEDPLGVAPGTLTRALGFGTSQSGRFLRTFLYYGFNRDERERRVFDGVLAHVAGGGRGSFNHRFAQPSRDAHPYLNFVHPTDIFPFADRTMRDATSGWEDGLLRVYDSHPDWLPKIFYTNSSYEYWGRAASLIHTTPDGLADAEIPDNVRIYHFAGTNHGPGSFPPRTTTGVHPGNAVDYRWAMRALVVRLDEWVAAGRTPPPSQYGRIADRTLVEPTKLSWPKIPGSVFSPHPHKAYRADYGPRFYSEGIVDHEPPRLGPAFRMLVPALDADGNEVAGIRLPEVTAPLATHTGWNPFEAKAGPTGVLASMQGSFLALPKTRAEREASGDARRSIEERYASRAEYVGRVAEAALGLVEGGYLLPRDAAPVISSAAAKWDALAGK